MLGRLLFCALVSGVLAGLVVAGLQNFTTTPLIIEAEKYENSVDGTNATFVFPRLQNAPDALVVLADANGHGDDGAWAPEDGFQRTLFTSITAIGTTFGFALILLSIMILSKAQITARTGLMWGLAAFAASGFAPALGLSPELPGSAAAELSARQVWWFGTAFATATGLWLALRISTPVAIAIGLGLIVAPHVIGAPHPNEFTSAVPGELTGHFVAASLVVQAVAWSLTGTIAGYMWQRDEINAQIA